MQVKVSYGKENVPFSFVVGAFWTHLVYKTLLVVCLGDLVHMNWWGDA